MNPSSLSASADFFKKKVTFEDLLEAEDVARKDFAVIEQCIISGIPRENMHKVYCDGS